MSAKKFSGNEVGTMSGRSACRGIRGDEAGMCGHEGYGDYAEEPRSHVGEKGKRGGWSIGVVVMAMVVSQMLAFADPSISTMVNNAVNLVFGMVAFGGIVNIVRGAATVAKGLQDDGGGQDASAISKGRGQLLAGAVMVAPTALITLITQQSPGTLIATYFS